MKQLTEQKVSSRPYDDAFKTMMYDCKNLLIPLVNELFGMSYDADEPVIFYNNEHIIINGGRDREKRINDSAFGIAGRRYVFECQTRPDDSMVVRMFEYIVLDAMDSYEVDGNVMYIRVPGSAVLFLRHDEDMPEHMKIIMEYENDRFEFPVHILCLKNYSLEELLEKKLYFLLPFYIFAYEDDFGEINSNPDRLDRLTADFKTMISELQRLTKEGDLSYYNYRTIIDMINYVLKHLAAEHDNILEGVNTVMGGTVLEHEAKTIYNAGISEGRLEGKVKALFYDADYSIEDISKKLDISEEEVERIVFEEWN